MGVIKKNDARVGVFYSSSQESLHIPQSSEDDRSVVSQDEFPTNHPAVRTHHQIPRPMYFASPRKRLGKKKSRHYENVIQLMTLVEDEELGDITIYDLIPNTPTGFSAVLSDESAFQVWDTFINSSEEVQQEILRENELQPMAKRKSNQPPEKQLTGEEAFMNIKTGIRNKLKKTSVPQGMLDYLESNLVEFFTQDSTKTYVSEAISSFERLLLHAISQYHRLISQSIDSELARQVHVHNPYGDVFQQPTVLLGEYLESRKNSN